jgi:hypothetical protein
MNENLETIKNALQIDEKSFALGSQHSHFLVQERKNFNQIEPKNCLKKVTIEVQKGFRDFFAFSPDDFLNGKNLKKKKYPLHPLLSNTEDYQKCCDKVIIFMGKNQLEMVFIEMKNSLGGGNLGKARIQLCNTKNFFKHLVNLIIEHNEITGTKTPTLKKLFDNNKVRFHSLIFTAESEKPKYLAKKPCRGNSKQEISIPENIEYNLTNSSTLHLTDLIK